MKKKILSMLLAVVMLISVLPMSAIIAMAWPADTSSAHHPKDGSEGFVSNVFDWKDLEILVNESGTIEGINAAAWYNWYSTRYNSTDTHTSIAGRDYGFYMIDEEYDTVSKLSKINNLSNEVFLGNIDLVHGKNITKGIAPTAREWMHLSLSAEDCSFMDWNKNYNLWIWTRTGSASGNSFESNMGTMTGIYVNRYFPSKTSSGYEKIDTIKSMNLVGRSLSSALRTYSDDCYTYNWDASLSNEEALTVIQDGKFNYNIYYTPIEEHHSWTEATVDHPKYCSVCGKTEGEKLPSIHASYVDPVTGETVELGKATNDGVTEVVDALLSKPMQVPNNIFLGWYTDKGALNKHTTRFNTFTNVTASFAGVTPMAKDPADEKMVDDYLSFELVGAQIRQENTIEDDSSSTTDKEVYGGLRYISSFEEDLYNTIGKSNVIEYGILLASKDNAKLFADHYGVSYDKYEIQYNTGVNGGTADTDFRYVTNVVCSGLEDHRTFDNYRLFTAVIDYEGAEELKGTEFVARSYIKYRDANSVERIFYGDYRGTKVFGGCSISYNRADAMTM